MKTPLLSLLGIAALATFANAQTLYLTADTTSVRKSTDGGSNWSSWVTGGTNFRGIATDPVSGTVFFNDRGASVADTRPLYAYNSVGTQIASTTYNATGGFNQQPVGYYNGYVYVNAGSAGGSGAQQFGLSSWNGSSLSSMSSAAVGAWQGNDITFATSGGTNYMYYGGTSGTAFRRSTLNSSGVATATTAVTLSAGSGSFPANFNDFALTSSGRVLTVGENGFWLSGQNQYTSNSISLTQTFSFSGTENTGTGDMGANARDFAMIGSDIYAVTNTNIFRYSLNDINGTISFVSANAHGFNSASVQIAAIPEPATWALLAGGLTTVMFLRRRRRA